MKPVVQHAAATLELGHAAGWYETKAGLGDRFFASVQRAKAFIRRNPQLGTPYRRGTRKWPVRGFPDLIICRDEPEWILIVAVAHGNREPGYWERRLDV